MAQHIRDATLWKATQLAYKYMVKEKNFDKSVAYYSDKYDIDPNVLGKEVRKMQKDIAKGKPEHKREKVYREVYDKPHKAFNMSVLNMKDCKAVIAELKQVGDAAFENGDTHLCEVCQKAVLAIADLSNVVFG